MAQLPETVKSEIDAAFAEAGIDRGLHGDCVNDCRQAYEQCLFDGLDDCRGTLESCINNCPDGRQIESGKLKALFERLDRIQI